MQASSQMRNCFRRLHNVSHQSVIISISIPRRSYYSTIRSETRLNKSFSFASTISSTNYSSKSQLITISENKNWKDFTQSIPSLCKDFHTVRDFVRYATSQFNKYDLKYGQCTTSAYEDSVFLIMETLQLPIDNNTVDITTWFDCKLTQNEKENILNNIYTRITTRKPTAYIMNKAYYHNEPYIINENVIIPRSYIGEMLLNAEYVNKGNEYLINSSSIRTILDLCTGSGVLAIHASKIFDSVESIHASDISEMSIEVANRNIAAKDLGNLIRTYQGDLFNFVGVSTYDLIICNPPYVDEDSMRQLPPEYMYEPISTLAAGPDGFSVISRVIREASCHLNDKGVLLCEVGKRRPDLEKHFPKLARKLYWLNSEISEGEVFLAKREDLQLTVGN